MVDIKTVLAVQVVFLLVLVFLRLLLTLLSFLVYRFQPQPFALVIFGEFADVHGNSRLVINE